MKRTRVLAMLIALLLCLMLLPLGALAEEGIAEEPMEAVEEPVPEVVPAAEPEPEPQPEPKPMNVTEPEMESVEELEEHADSEKLKVETFVADEDISAKTQGTTEATEEKLYEEANTVEEEIEDSLWQDGATNGHTQAEAVAWVNSQIGKAIDYDGVYGAQCVDLTKYYYSYLGQSIPVGTANQYANGGAFTPPGWSYQSRPQAGDIVVWTGGSYGHVAIVTEIRSSSFVVVEQNYAGKQYCTEREIYYSSNDATTYIRPDFQKDTELLTGTWKKSLGGWWYQFSDGTYPANRMYEIDGKKYYFTSSGYLYNGWKQVDGSWYYFTSSGAVTGWKKLSGSWYYFNTNGVMLTGLQTIGAAKYYFKDSGAMATGWRQIGTDWYYFNASGAMRRSSWLKSGSSWYYFGSDGKMYTGLKNIGGTYYYFKSSGAMATGWQQIGSDWYYFNSSGAMRRSSWLKSGSSWYWLDANGRMATGWKQIDGQWYYFYSGGIMATSVYMDGYWIDSSGARRDKADGEYQSVYRSVLQSNKTAINDSSLLNSYASKTVSIGDVNADGIPELMFLCNGNMFYNYKIFTYYDSAAVEVYNGNYPIFYGGMTTLIVYVSKDKQTLYIYDADGDEGYHGESFVQYRLTGKKLTTVKTLIWSIDPSGKERFSINGSSVSSSAYLKEFNSMVNDCSELLFYRAGGVGRPVLYTLEQSHTSTARNYTNAMNYLS